MHRLRRLIPLLLLPLLLLSCDKVSEKMREFSKAERPYRSVEGRYSITLPAGLGDPVDSLIPEEIDSVGEPLLHHTLSAESSDGELAVIVSYFDLDNILDDQGDTALMPLLKEVVLDTIISGMAEKITDEGGRITQIGTITRSGLSGRSFTGTESDLGAEAYVRAECVIDQHRIYQLMYLSTDREAAFGAEGEAFFASFKVRPPAAGPAPPDSTS